MVALPLRKKNFGTRHYPNKACLNIGYFTWVRRTNIKFLNIRSYNQVKTSAILNRIIITIYKKSMTNLNAERNSMMLLSILFSLVNIQRIYQFVRYSTAVLLWWGNISNIQPKNWFLYIQCISFSYSILNTISKS